MKRQIDAGYPIPTLILDHKNRAMKEYVWHWFLINAYDDGAPSDVRPSADGRPLSQPLSRLTAPLTRDAGPNCHFERSEAKSRNLEQSNAENPSYEKASPARGGGPSKTAPGLNKGLVPGSELPKPDGIFRVKALTYSEYEWLDLSALWDTGEGRKGGFIEYSFKASS